MGNMFISEERTHVYRGKGYPHRCEMCHWQIQEGQEYHRWVMRQGNSPLFVCVRHADDRDCPWEEEERMRQEMYEETFAEVSIPIEMVLTERLVAKVALNGDTIYETESVMEMRTGGSPPENDDSEEEVSYDPDDQDEIPF